MPPLTRLFVKTALAYLVAANKERALQMVPVYQEVRTFDKRLQTLDAEPQRFLTGEKKDVIVDSFAFQQGYREPFRTT